MKTLAKQLGFLVISLAMILGATCHQVYAHDLWIQVRDYTPMVNEETTMTLGYDHYFPTRGFMDKKDLEEIYVLNQEGNKVGIKAYSDVEFKGVKSLKKK